MSCYLEFTVGGLIYRHSTSTGSCLFLFELTEVELTEVSEDWIRAAQQKERYCRNHFQVEQ